jgi:hypothetical protein
MDGSGIPSAIQEIVGGAVKNAKDNVRNWMWLVIAVGVASQFYFVRELAAAFALFVLGFLLIALMGAALLGVVKVWELVATRMASSNPAILPMGAVKASRGTAQSY